jgi:RNA polymerase sigma-70 factor (ECF subfamily)
LHFRRNRDEAKAEGGSDALRRLQDLPDSIAIESHEDTIEVGTLFRSAIEQVRGQFQEPTWQAFWLSTIDGRAPADLAAELGMTPAAIRQAKSRVLRRLKLEMGDLLK